MFKSLRPANVPAAIEQRSIQLSDQVVTYTLKRSSNRRSIGLRIDERGLTVNMPLRASEKWLHSVLQDKASWVVEKLGSWSQRKEEPQQWHHGAALPFRGEQFILHIEPGLFASAPVLRGDRLMVYVRDSDDLSHIQRVVETWYKQEALRVFEECVMHFSQLLQVTPRDIKLSSARTQWGSCTAQGVVRLNWRLVKMPLHLIDYVVVHELAHLVEMNHSERFWRVVASVYPDYQASRKELLGLGIAE